MMKWFLPLFSCLMTACLVAGCGYKLSGTGSSLPPAVKTVAVVPFENRTLEPEIGTAMAEAMQREVLKREALEPANPWRADAVLSGVVEEVELEPQAYDDEGFTTAYRARMRVSAKLKRGGEVLWRADDIVREEEVAITSNIRDNQVRRRMALEAITEDVAEEIHLTLIEGW